MTHTKLELPYSLCLGVYFLHNSVDPVLKRGWHLNRVGIDKIVLDELVDDVTRG